MFVLSTAIFLAIASATFAIACYRRSTLQPTVTSAWFSSLADHPYIFYDHHISSMAWCYDSANKICVIYDISVVLSTIMLPLQICMQSSTVSDVSFTAIQYYWSAGLRVWSELIYKGVSSSCFAIEHSKTVHVISFYWVWGYIKTSFLLSLRFSQNQIFYWVSGFLKPLLLWIWGSPKIFLLLSLGIAKILILFKEMNVTFRAIFVWLFGFDSDSVHLGLQHHWFSILTY